MLFSAQLIKMHAQDFLDQRIIEGGYFKPSYGTGKIQSAIQEIVEIMNYSINHRDLKITYD